MIVPLAVMALLPSAEAVIMISHAYTRLNRLWDQLQNGPHPLWLQKLALRRSMHYQSQLCD